MCSAKIVPFLTAQDRTSRYIARLGKELEKMLFSTRAETDLVDLSLLKCRQKDQLEEAFKSWRCDVPCNSEWGRKYICAG